MLILVCSIFISAISCAKAPCKKKGISFDKGLMNEKIPAIGKVVRKVASKGTLTQETVDEVCRRFGDVKVKKAGRLAEIGKEMKLEWKSVRDQVRCDGRKMTVYQNDDVCDFIKGGSWKLLKEIKKEAGLSWKTIAEETRCDPWDSVDISRDRVVKYALTIFDQEMIIGKMPNDFYFEILEDLQENHPKTFKKIMTEKLDFPRNRFVPDHAMLTLHERLCQAQYNLLVFSDKGRETRRLALENLKDYLWYFSEFGQPSECKDLKKIIHFADTGTFKKS